MNSILCCFGLNLLITIALTARSQHYFDSGVVWWSSFLPLVCVLWQVASGKDFRYLFIIFSVSILNYLVFHAHHFGFFGYWMGFFGYTYTIISVFILSFVTFSTYLVMRDD